MSSNVKYHAIWSNQCIELWFLLHFEYFNVDNSRETYYPKITKYLSKINKGKYEKNRDDIFEILIPYIDDAIRNAKKLIELQFECTSSSCAPGTMVFEFVEMIRPYLNSLEKE